jgi:hypothetical protein
MQVIAVTVGGVLISATNDEVNEILRSTNGAAPKELGIGQKIPAIDYAGSITKLKALSGSCEFKELGKRMDYFVAEFNKLKESVDNAASVE